MTAVEKVKHPARTGDLVLIETAERHAELLGVSLRYDVAEVTNVFRTGQIKKVRRLDFGDDGATQELVRWVGYRQCWLVAASAVNKASLVTELRAHRYPTAPDSSMIMPWSDPQELKALIFRHRIARITAKAGA